MKIVIAEKIASQAAELLRAENWEVVIPAAADLERELETADALIVRSAVKVDHALLEKMPQLRVVGRAGVGVDNVDTDAATRQGVLVLNTPGGNATSVAEHTIALMLAMARAIPDAAASVRAGKWEKKKFLGHELRGKTLGIVGLGSIGKEVAKRARAMEMQVVAFDPYARDSAYQLVPFDDLCARADYVTLHVSLTPETEKMLNAAALVKMKKGVRVINCGRGELIDEPALAAAIGSGQVAGAALDVFAVEPPPADHPLARLPQVIATPHIAGSTEEAQEIVGIRIAEQVRDYLKQGVIVGAVNVPAPSAEEYRVLAPYLTLAERLGSFVAQISEGRPHTVRFALSGKVAEVNTALLRNAALKGILNRLAAERANLVNAATLAAERGITLEDVGSRGTVHGDALRLSIVTSERESSAEGGIFYGDQPRLLQADRIHVEAPLAGSLIFFKNYDVPGVIGRIGTLLGEHKVNIANFSLGRREMRPGEEGPAKAVAVVLVDGKVPEAVLARLREIEPVRYARAVEIS